MTTLNGLDDLQTAIGSHLGYSDWHIITQEQINQFAQATGDHQWIHTDPERAARGPYGSTIAHGYLVLSLIPLLMTEALNITGVSMAINYGSDKVRFPAPTPSGSRVRAGFELSSVKTQQHGVQVIQHVTIERDGGDKPVCVADIVSLLIP